MNFTKEHLSNIQQLLKSGEVIILPTDTIPGFSTLATNPEASKKITKLKKRAPEKPFLLLASSIEMIKEYVEFPKRAEKLAEKFWPGGLTIILPRKKDTLPDFFPNAPELAFRIPNIPLLLELIEKIGVPLVSTSINKTGEDPLITPEEIQSKYPEIIQCLNKQRIMNPCSKVSENLPSTIIRITNQEDVKILREGVISKEEIQQV